MNCARGIFVVVLAYAAACELRQDLGRMPATGDAGADMGTSSTPSFPTTTSRAGWRWVSPFPTGDDLRGVFASPSGDVWIVGANGTVLRRAGDGSIREMLEPDVETRYYAGCGMSDQDVWIVGEQRGATKVRRWDGKRWTDSYSLRDHPVHSLACADHDTAWATASVFALRWNGAEWLVVPADTVAPLRAIWPSGPNDAWAVGDRGRLLRWDGSAFRDPQPVASSPVFETQRNYVAVWGHDASDVWAAYEAPTRRQVGFVHFDGSTWSDTPALAVECRTRPETTAPLARGARMAGTSASRIVATLGQGCTFSYDGERWQVRTLTDPLTREVAVSSVVAVGTNLFAVGDRGVLARFDELSDPAWVPLYPALRDDLSGVSLVGDEPWALAPGRVVRLVSGKWELVAGTERASAFTVGSSGGSELWVAREAGPSESEILRASEAGAAFAPTAKVTARVTTIAEREGTVWLAGDGYVARGDGRSFTSFATGTDETFTSIAPIDGNTAVVSGTKSLGMERFARKVLRIAGGRIETLVADESGSMAAPAFATAGEIWVGGMPLLRMVGAGAERISLGDDSPVDAITTAGGRSLWLGGGGLIRHWDGASDQLAFGAGRVIHGLAGRGETAWAVGESGATLVYLAQGTPR